MKNRRAGMTLVEVLLAAMLLGLAMMGIFTCLSKCLRLVSASREAQKVNLVFDLIDFKYPINAIKEEDDFEEVEVEGDASDLASDLGDERSRKELEGYRYQRKFDEKLAPEDDDEPNDHLFICRTVVTWGDGEDEREERVEYFYLPEIDGHEAQ